MSRSRRRNVEVSEQTPELEVVPGTEGTLDESPIPKAWKFSKDTELDFWGLLRQIPEAEWQSLMVYLYRLDPAVRNADGEKKYIQRYPHAIDEERIKEDHGGGRYMLHLNWYPPNQPGVTLKSTRITIEGAAKLKEGQTIAGNAPVTQNPAAPGAPQNGENNALVGLVRELVGAIKGKSTPEEQLSAAMGIMRKAYEESISLVGNQSKSMTGNPLMDEFFRAQITRINATPEKQDPIALVRNLVGVFKDLQPTSASPAAGGLSFLKEIFGQDFSLADLLTKDRGRPESGWVELAKKAVDALPGVLQQFANMQQAAYMRAMEVARFRRNAMVLPGAPPPQSQPANPMAHPSIAGAPAAPPQNGAATPDEITAAAMASAVQIQNLVTETIVRCFMHGVDGEATGITIKMAYPEIAQELAPFMGNAEQVDMFIKSEPRLLELTKDPNWKDFLQDFIEEMQAVEEEQLPAPPAAAESTAAPTPVH